MFASGQLVAGRYRLLRLLGEGGMGAVWAATNEAILRDVAIKVMRPSIAEDPIALQRFFNEARICGSIRHPGIVDVLDLGRAEDGSPFLVMERLEGEALDRKMERERVLRPSVILPIVRDVARTIALAHERGVIHRDLKPANLFLHRPPGGTEIVKVLDFGISKVIGPMGSGESKATQTGTVVGSPAYMSPENALGKVSVDARTDVYSLGVILFEALTGRMPFESDNYNALIVDIATGDPPDIAELAPGLPPPVIDLVRAAMAKDRERRVRTMGELADRIDAILARTEALDRAITPALAPVPRRVPDPAEARTASVLTANVTTAHANATPWRSIVLGALLAIALSSVAFVVLMRSAPTASSSASPGDSAAPLASEASAAPTSAPTAPVVAPSPTPSVAAQTVAATSAPSASAAANASTKTKPSKPGTKAPRKTGGVWGYE